MSNAVGRAGVLEARLLGASFRSGQDEDGAADQEQACQHRYDYPDDLEGFHALFFPRTPIGAPWGFQP
ncbi:MAG: hypothetical protein ACPLYD_05455, partial [Anaerolineae bacterium]